MGNYDSRLPLAVRGPNVLGAMSAGQTMGARANEIKHTNALRDLYQQQGADILKGDPNALGALAGLDPGAAMDIQAQQQNMSIQREKMEMLRAEGQRAAQRLQMQMSAADLEREQGKLKQGIAAAMTAQSPEEWDAIASQFGAEDLVGQFGNRDAIVAFYSGLDSTLDRMKGERTTAVETLHQRALASGMEEGSPDYQKFMQTGGKEQPSRMVMGPDGRPVYVEGDAAKGFDFTESESKTNVYATRAQGALDVLEPVAGELTSRGYNLADYVPLGLGREIQSDDFQVAQQAGLEFLQAILRKDTGAAITQEETDSYGKTYLPQPGDSEAVIEAKRQSRIRAINAIESGMSAQQMLARDRALIKSAQEERGKPTSRVPDFRSMTDEELDAWIEENGGAYE